MVERDLGRLDAADAMFVEEADLCTQLDDEFRLQSSLGNRAQLLRSAGRYDEALELLVAQEHLCRNLADPAAISRSLAGQAAVLADRGDVAEAIALTEQFASTSRTEGDRRGLVEALLNLAVMHGQLGAADAALQSIGEAESWRARPRPARTAGACPRHAGIGARSARRLGHRGARRSRGRTDRTPGRVARPGCARARGVRHRPPRTGRPARRARCRTSPNSRSRGRPANDRRSPSRSRTSPRSPSPSSDTTKCTSGTRSPKPLMRELDTPSTLLPLLANRGQVNHMSGRFPEALADLTDATVAASRLGYHAAVTQWGDLRDPARLPTR